VCAAVSEFAAIPNQTKRMHIWNVASIPAAFVQYLSQTNLVASMVV
jgi:hypothetical protein